MANGTVSIYIDDTIVRIMVTRGKRMTRLADMPLEAGLSSIDTPEKEAVLAGKIRQLLKINKIGSNKIIVGLSGLHCLTRPVLLPELPKAMIGEAVVREAKRLLPMPLEQLYLSWQVISTSGGKTQVFLVALPRQMADTIIRVMNKAGCKPYLMDIKPLALARLSREATAIILDVQPKEFDIVIMINGIPQPVRTIAFPQEALSLPEKLNMVKEDLKRTLDFLKNKVEETQLQPETTIFVSGELTEHPEFYEPLATELGLKVAKLVSPLKYLKYLEPSQYLVNSGLALKVMVKEVGPLLPNFNTLPTPYQPKRISLHKLMAVPAGVCAVSVVVLLAITVQNAGADIAQIKGQLENTNFMLTKKLAQKKQMTVQVATLKQQIEGAAKDYDLYSLALKQLATTGNNMNNDLTTTVDTVPTGLLINNIAVDDAVIGISGNATSENEVFEYVRDLTNSGRFKQITISSISLSTTITTDEDGNFIADPAVDYNLNCILKADR
jgi:type IV pilus assembly protein PilM